jgi:hypothetical protein
LNHHQNELPWSFTHAAACWINGVVEHCKITISKHQISAYQGLMGVPARLALLAWRAGHRIDDCGMLIENLLKSS